MNLLLMSLAMIGLKAIDHIIVSGLTKDLHYIFLKQPKTLDYIDI